jgi:hypothetical protein
MSDDSDLAAFMKRSNSLSPPPKAAAEPTPTSMPTGRGARFHPDEAKAATPTPVQPAPAEPEIPEEELPWGQRHDIARGIPHGLAALGTNAVRLQQTLGNIFAPNLTQVVKRNMPDFVRSAYHRAREYADEPSQSTTETVARGAAETLPLMAIPGGPVEAFVGRRVLSQLPQIAAAVSPRAAAITGAIARGAGAAERGAVGGAIADPEHPGAGAAAGAIGGAIPGAAGDILRSRAGQSIGAHGLAGIATAGVIYALHHGAGLPYELVAGLAIPGIRWTRTPSGRMVHLVGERLVDAAGQIVGHIPAGVAGFAAGRAAPAVLPPPQEAEQ